MEITVRNTSSFLNIPSEYQPIMDDAVAAYEKVLDKHEILNIRLMGSVGRGTCQKYLSDIDFICICSSRRSMGDLKSHLDEVSLFLSEKHPLVRLVDLELVNTQKISEFKEFVLKTDSLSLRGIDLYPQDSVVIDSDHLARLVSPDLDQLAADYSRMLLVPGCTQDQILKVSRWIGKDCLKCLRFFAITRHGLYSTGIAEIHAALVKSFPAQKDTFDQLYANYQEPSLDVSYLTNLLALSQKTKHALES